ncbi:hypothetical protein [Oceanibium sediminis]|uniref:hypothetical protein n=1 Tax=Oceanibium sediminis TaxID=2026339 RepID=UPI000DD36096|nr:hypothetical protein [Oceanibium sediminis]
MRLPILALAALAASATALPAQQQDPAARVMGYVTSRYLEEFDGIRRQIAQLEVLNACGEQDLVASVIDGLVAEELTLRRQLLSDVMALDAENLPEPEARRAIATALLDALGIADSTTRALMLEQGSPGRPPAAVCDAARDALAARAGEPQPTAAKP